MNSGRVEQVGTPQEIYHHPATRFAAEFVGENNVFDGQRVDSRAVGRGRDDGRRDDSGVETEGSTIRVKGVDFRLPPVETDEVTFCVRPEAFRVGHEISSITGTVSYAEFLGESVRVGLEWEGRTLVVRTDEMPTDGTLTDPAPTGEILTVGFDRRT